MCVHYFTLRVHYFSCCFLHWAVIFCFSLCVHYFSVCVHYICSELVVCSEPWLSSLSAPPFFTRISPRWYMYFPKMIHVFLQDDITIACTISVESCLPWAVIELAVRPTCSQNLEDVEVTLHFFSLHVCIYSFMQQCKYAQPSTMSCNIFHFSLYAATNCYQHVTHCVVKFVFT